MTKHVERIKMDNNQLHETWVKLVAVGPFRLKCSPHIKGIHEYAKGQLISKANFEVFI